MKRWKLANPHNPHVREALTRTCPDSCCAQPPNHECRTRRGLPLRDGRIVHYARVRFPQP